MDSGRGAVLVQDAGVAPTAPRAGSRCRRCGGAGRRLRRTRGGAAERGEHDLSALAEVAKDTVRDGERADARRVDGPVADACLQPNILDPAEHERRDLAPRSSATTWGRSVCGCQARIEGRRPGRWRTAGLEAFPCLAERLELVQATRHSNARAAPCRLLVPASSWVAPRAAYGGRAGRRRIGSCVPRHAIAPRRRADAWHRPGTLTQPPPGETRLSDDGDHGRHRPGNVGYARRRTPVYHGVCVCEPQQTGTEPLHWSLHRAVRPGSERMSSERAAQWFPWARARRRVGKAIALLRPANGEPF